MSDALDAGSVVAGRYTVVRELGRGGMAVVYEVVNQHLGTACALKVLTVAGRAVRERLTLEGQVQSAIAHPNVLNVFDVVDVEGAPGLILELVRGPALDRLLAEQRLDWTQCDALAEGILAGMAAAHGAGLIHRDLKPANVLCAIVGGKLVPKIADFGLAKVLHDDGGPGVASKTRSGTTMGTPSYMAPEQVRNAGKVDARADVFSLGALLYEMCCGCKAFDGDDLLAIYMAVANGQYKPPRELAPDLPDRMERAILGALEPDRDKRIKDVLTLAAVWRGERDDWTESIGLDATTSGGPWDPGFLQRYGAGSSSGERTFRSGSPLPASHKDNQTFTETGPVALPASARSGSRSGPPALARRRPWWLAVPLLALFGAAVLGSALVGGIAVLGWRGLSVEVASSDRSDVAPEVVVTDVVVAPPPRPPEVPLPPEPVAPPEAPAPEPVAKTKVHPTAPVPVEPVAVAPEPAPVAPAPVSDGRFAVELRGDAQRVYLEGPAGQERLPGRFPPGTYKVVAFFDASDPSPMAAITVTRDTVLSCDTKLRRCK